MTVFLIGFMGSGKTTIGRKLAAKLNCDCIDLDHAIEKAGGMYIRDIIAEKGEPYFRKAEADTLREIELSGKVIATGGGTPCFYDNMAWMLSKGKVIYIEMNEGMLFSRLKTTGLASRPLVKGLDDEGLKQFIHNKLKEREPYYLQAEIKFDPVKQSLDDLVDSLTS
jgi:shikimate kinase